MRTRRSLAWIGASLLATSAVAWWWVPAWGIVAPTGAIARKFVVAGESSGISGVDDLGDGRRGIALWSDGDPQFRFELRDGGLARVESAFPATPRSSSVRPTGRYSIAGRTLVRTSWDTVTTTDGDSVSTWRAPALIAGAAVPFDRATKIVIVCRGEREEGAQLCAYGLDGTPLWSLRRAVPRPDVDSSLFIETGAAPASDEDEDGIGDLCLIESVRSARSHGSRITVLSAADPPREIRSAAIETPGVAAWSRIVALGDSNGDGVAELAIGAPGEEVAIVDGATFAILHRRRAPPGIRYFGAKLANARDLDGDGADDLIVVGVKPTCGLVQVVSGRTGETLLEQDVSYAGWLQCDVIAGLGDLDGDGRGELALLRPAEARPIWSRPVTPPARLTIWSGAHALSGRLLD